MYLRGKSRPGFQRDMVSETGGWINLSEKNMFTFSYEFSLLPRGEKSLENNDQCRSSIENHK